MRKKINFFLCAFFGGTMLSWIDIMTNPSHISPYFFIGLLAAGIVGIGGYLTAGETNMRSAFMIGISAPQLLGSVIKGGSSVTSLISLFPVVMAQPVDSTAYKLCFSPSIVITTDNRDVKVLSQNREYYITSKTPAIIPWNDSMQFMINNKEQTIQVGKDIDTLNIVTIEKQRTASILEALFPMQDHSELSEKYEIHQDKKIETNEDLQKPGDK